MPCIFLYRNETMMSFKQMTYAIVFRDVICFLCYDSFRVVNYLTMRVHLQARIVECLLLLFTNSERLRNTAWI